MSISLKSYINDIIRERKSGPLAGVLKFFLSAAALFYAILARLHGFLYRTGLLKRYRVSVPVVSVGNITLGGTGKTPCVIMLARYLSEKGKAPAVLIRGYGEDEWKMLGESLKGTAAGIFVGRDRVRKAEASIRQGKNVIILDDGFQHRRLRRDLDIALVDGHSPFGNSAMFPRGILREPKNALKRADFIIVTKSDFAGGNLPAVISEIKKIAGEKPVLEARHAIRDFTGIKGEKKEKAENMKGKEVVLLSAICDPDYFAHTAALAGLSVRKHFSFPDHYDYRAGDLKGVFKACESENIEYVVTTEKDAVKLEPIAERIKSGTKLFVLRISFELTKGRERLYAGLDSLASH